MPNTTDSETFAAISARYLSRRRLLGGGLAAGALLVAQASPLGLGAASAAAPQGSGRLRGSDGLTFAPIALEKSDAIVVPVGYTASTLIGWGDPLFGGSRPATGMITLEQQMRAFGYNCDYIGFLPLRGNTALLAVNHEYTNPELMFAGYNSAAPTREQVDIDLAAHGMSIVEIRRRGRSGWQYVANASRNRRIHGFTPVGLTGPAAGHALLRTSADPSGQTVLGTLNNCSAGITPWGTVLTCEENFNQYFANRNGVADAATKAAHTRYGLPTGPSERKWENHHTRFDQAQEPNEPFRYGWVVEVDPYDPGATPRKHTALGRFKHEATSTVLAGDGRAVVYMGDDERFDYMYKFVSEGGYQRHNQAANLHILEAGTLYVARLNDDGTGEWLPLVHGTGPLTAANGFADQGEVLVKTRLAADLLAPTKMDRPEDIEVNPANGKVYAVMTNNSNRTAANVNAANPRPTNRSGHIIELTPANDDHAAAAFTWDIFMLCGDPNDPSTYFAGYDKSEVSPIACPDNITFDQRGNLWIATDGVPNVFPNGNDGIFAVPVEGKDRGYVRQFMSGVPGGEMASLTLDDRDMTLFVTVQHPGENSTFEAPSSNFPDGAGSVPRPSVVYATRDSGTHIGS